MDKILFVNACVQKESRTMILAQTLLEQLNGSIKEVNLNQDRIQPLYSDTLSHRLDCLAHNVFDDPIYDYAHDFADADLIVFAAPLWDNSIPTILKAYIERIMAQGVTFTYSEKGEAASLCKAKKFYFVSTAGGNTELYGGYDYVKEVMMQYFGIKDSQLFMADSLDIAGVDVAAVLKAKCQEIKENISPCLT